MRLCSPSHTNHSGVHADSRGSCLIQLPLTPGLGPLSPGPVWDMGSVLGLLCVWCCSVLFAVGHSLVYSGEPFVSLSRSVSCYGHSHQLCLSVCLCSTAGGPQTSAAGAGNGPPPRPPALWCADGGLQYSCCAGCNGGCPWRYPGLRGHSGRCLLIPGCPSCRSQCPLPPPPLQGLWIGVGHMVGRSHHLSFPLVPVSDCHHADTFSSPPSHCLHHYPFLCPPPPAFLASNPNCSR